MGVAARQVTRTQGDIMPNLVDEAAPALLLLTDERPVCFHCCERIADDDPEPMSDPDGCDTCEECHDEHCCSCYNCNDVIWQNDANTGPDDNRYCESCSDSFFTCDDCSNPAWDRDGISTDNGRICVSCYHDGYFTCQGCDTVLSDDEYGSDGYCNSCEEDNEEEESSHLIKPYSDKSANSLGFFGECKDKTYYGVELEVECASGDREECAETVQGCLGDDFAVLKEDGSLSNGFEIVTAPATVEEHSERFRDFLGSSKKRGLKSWDTSTCGMHVHVSRKPLSDLTVGKMMVFVNEKSNQPLVAQVAGRSDVHWCKVVDKKVSDAHPSNRYCGSNNDRYTALNVTGSKTVEFRIFKGTLKYESFMKNLEFVRSVVTFCRTAGIQELTQERYLAHVASRRKDYPNLVAFLRDRRFLPAPKPCKSFLVKSK